MNGDYERGDIDDIDVLTAKKITLLPATSPKTVFWGRVSRIDNDLITIKDKDSKRRTFQTKNQASLKMDDYVIVSGVLNEDLLEATFVYAASPSAKVKPATQSGKKR